MKHPFRLLIITSVSLMISACATSLSEQLTGQKFPVAKAAAGSEVARLEFSSDKKYETTKGVPLVGDPLICKRDGTFRVNDDNSISNQISINAGEEIAVTSVISWVNTGFRKTCGPFVSFTPEQGSKYIVVNERIGGKGASWMWTGIAFQTCEVSVYKELPSGFERVPTRKVTNSLCHQP